MSGAPGANVASVLVLTPQIEEARGVLDGFRERGFPHVEADISALTSWAVPALDMVVAVGGNGKAQFGVQAQYLIDRCHDAKLLVCVGAAGRLVDTVAVGDVVVGTATIEHDYKERFIVEPLPCHAGHAETVTQFARAARERDFAFGVHVGPIASGDEDIVDPDRAADVHGATRALCVAWEGSGGARAARFSGIGFVEIRAITDVADEQAAASFHCNLHRVMPNAADLILAWYDATRAGAPQVR